jgi:two-component system chemotaxis sensor kinase CheA
MDKSADSQMLEDINPLKEFSYVSVETAAQKTLRCLFAPVDQGGGEVFVMGTIQDITAETVLKKQLAEEEARRQDEMRNLFEVMQVDQKVLGDFIEDANYEFDRINGMLKDKKLPNRQLLVNIYQNVHSIKSNAVIIGLSGYGERLHGLETEIKTLSEKEGEPSNDDILHITVLLEERMRDMDKFPEIISRIKSFNAADAGIKKDDEVFIDARKQECDRIACDEQKKVNLVIDAFDKEALDRGPRRVMKEILIQLVRNAVHHGIESPAERLARGKEETGKITLSVSAAAGAVRMILRDDGRGLDFGRIAQKAKERGLLKNPESNNNDAQALLNCIFSPGFSTSQTEDMHAGRGIGLNIVKDRLREVKGKLGVQTQKGRGLAFDIRIPADR